MYQFGEGHNLPAVRPKVPPPQPETTQYFAEKCLFSADKRARAENLFFPRESEAVPSFTI